MSSNSTSEPGHIVHHGYMRILAHDGLIPTMCGLEVPEDEVLPWNGGWDCPLCELWYETHIVPLAGEDEPLERNAGNE